MVLSIALVNVQNKSDINNYIEWCEQNNISLLCATEASELLKVEDYDLIHSPIGGRGVAVVVIDKNLSYKCPYAKRRHVVIKIVGVRLMINAWYLSPNDDPPEVVELESLLEKGAKGVVHLGDLNARSKRFEDHENKRGRRLMEACQRGNFTPLNQPGVPTFHGKGWKGGKSIIDWVLVSNEILNRAQLEVLPALFGSDHELLVVTLAYKGEILKEPEHKVIAPGPFIRRIDAITDDEDTADWFIKLMDAVTFAQKSKSKRRPDPPTEELRVLRMQLNDLMSTIKAKKGTSSHLWSTYRQLSTLYKEREKLEKNRAEYQRISRLENKSFWAECRKVAGKTTKVKQLNHEDAVLKGKEASQLLIDHFFPDGAPDDYELPDELPPDDQPLTKVEIETALSHFKSNTAPGKSGVSFSLLKQWYSRRSNYFVNLFTQWYSAGIYPEELKESVVIALIKDKRMQASITNVRPVCLSETIARWYERAVDTRFMYYIEKSNLLTSDQFGFRPGLSAEKAARELQDMREANKKEFELIIQTDVKSAFDKVAHKSIINALIEAKLPGNIIRIITSFIKERRASMYMGEDWVTTVVRRGVPQGSCLGPHLYILTTNMMLKVLRDAMSNMPTVKSELVSFADDVVLLTSGDDPDDVIETGEQLVQTMEVELLKVGLSLSMNKLKFMLKGSESGDKILWQGREQELVEFMKILGITFSRDGSFNQHVKALEEKANRAIRQYSTLLRGGLSMPCRRQLMLNTIVPKLDYGANVWFRRLDARDGLALERITRLIGKAITGAPFHTGKHAAALMSRTIPFHLHCKKRALISEISSSRLEIDHKLNATHRSHPSEWRSRDFGGTMKTTEETSSINADLYLFTDGSRFDDTEGTHVGAAVVAMRGSVDDIRSAETIASLKLSPKNSVSQAELLALKYACIEAERANAGTKVAILSDSLSSLQAIKSPTPTYKLAVDCQNIIDKAREKGVHLSLHHVKAHVGVLGNTMADEAAKRAATYGTSIYVPASLAMAKSSIHDEVKLEYERWFVHGCGRKSSVLDFFTGPDDTALKSAIVTPVNMAFYSGHGWNLNSMRYGYERAGSYCSCGKVQTTKHVLVDCPKYMNDNLTVALKVGIHRSDFLGPWEQLRKHCKFHEYVNMRAPKLNATLRDDNIAHNEVLKVVIPFIKLNIDDEKESEEGGPGEGYLLPIYSDRYLSHYDVQSGWSRSDDESLLY